MVIVIETAIIIIILIIIWRIPTYQYLFDIFILMITIVTLRFCINLEKTHQILNNNHNYENISYLEYINTIIIMRWQ